MQTRSSSIVTILHIFNVSLSNFNVEDEGVYRRMHNLAIENWYLKINEQTQRKSYGQFINAEFLKSDLQHQKYTIYFVTMSQSIEMNRQQGNNATAGNTDLA